MRAKTIESTKKESRLLRRLCALLYKPVVMFEKIHDIRYYFANRQYQYSVVQISAIRVLVH